MIDSINELELEKKKQVIGLYGEMQLARERIATAGRCIEATLMKE